MSIYIKRPVVNKIGLVIILAARKCLRGLRMVQWVPEHVVRNTVQWDCSWIEHLSVDFHTTNKKLCVIV
jgi:hypothetical protein